MLYLDNAATTPLHPKVLEAMMPYLTESFANPSSVYTPARKVRAAIDHTRQIVAEAINVTPEEIFFTAGGTEADNWAIRGVLEAAFRKSGGGSADGHIITTQVEHHGVLFLCKYLEKQGYAVTYLPVDGEGFVRAADLEAAIRPDTRLITIMLANNEVGTIQPMEELSLVASSHGIPFHTDAVQAVGHIPIDAQALGVDMLALSAHKFQGPKGAGAMYIKKGTKIAPMFHGGAQERNRRAGTENVPGIIGLGAALKLSMEEMPTEQKRMTELSDRLIREILTGIPHVRLNGPRDRRLPGNVNISFGFIEGESLLLHLDMLGCCVSTGSACSSGALEPSHVLMAMELSHEDANGALRFSFGSGNTEADIDSLMAILIPAVKKLRDLSPLYDDYLKGL